MHLKKIDVSNFRLLKDADLSLDKRTTVIVGRNNSGKTSLTELFRRLSTGSSPTFQLEDFSLSVHDQFWKAFELKNSGKEDSEVLEVLPNIEVELTIQYDKDASHLGPIGDLIIDLDIDSTEVLVVVRYELGEGGVSALFDGLEPPNGGKSKQQRKTFFRTMKERVPKLYTVVFESVDPTDTENRKNLEMSQLRALMQGGFVNAQRGLDDVTNREKGVLGKILEALFNTAASELAHPKDKIIAQNLEDAVEKSRGIIDDDFNDQLKNLLPALKLFGYPGLNDPDLHMETTLDVKRLLVDNTKVQYGSRDAVSLPETYMGLGPRNLIFILFRLYEFFKSYKAKPTAPNVHLVFIEEPEAHLHPQMQEVFVRKLAEIAEIFAEQFNDKQEWPVQFIVTTHSSHVANEAPFEATRYFAATSDEKSGVPLGTTIKDLSKGLSNILPKNREFLHKYMTLTRCDLMFADKAILIEGITERLLMPKIIEKVEKDGLAKSTLSSQYISVIEVGGAHAHIFFDLLKFLELRTLVITDLDAVDESNEGIACRVSEGSNTSNECIKKWFDNKTIAPKDLIEKPDEEKINGLLRLCYEVPEEKSRPCGRSFEAAFILANPGLFGLTGEFTNDEEEAWKKSRSVKKSDFGLKYSIEELDWVVPRFISEGIVWLADIDQRQLGTDE